MEDDAIHFMLSMRTRVPSLHRSIILTCTEIMSWEAQLCVDVLLNKAHMTPSPDVLSPGAQCSSSYACEESNRRATMLLVLYTARCNGATQS